MYTVIPRWIYDLDTDEKLIACLNFIGREDLAEKYKKQGYLYVSEVINTSPIPYQPWISNDDNYEYIDFGVLKEDV